MKDRKIYQTKYIVSGDIIERFTYEKNQFVGFEPRNKSGKNKGVNSQENRNKSLYRARSIVSRTINSNPCLDKFLTLTFEENVTDLDYANNEFKNWVKRVNYQVFKTKKRVMKYLFELNLKLFDCILLSFCINNPIYVYQKAKEEKESVEKQ